MPQGLRDYGTGFLTGLTDVAKQARADTRAEEDRKAQETLAILQLGLANPGRFDVGAFFKERGVDLGLPKTKSGKGGQGMDVAEQLFASAMAGQEGAAPGAAGGGGADPTAVDAGTLGFLTQGQSQARDTQLQQSRDESAVARIRANVAPDLQEAALEQYFGAPERFTGSVGPGSTFIERGERKFTTPQQLSAASIQGVAGEVPNATGGFDPAFGILDRRPTSPTFGQYTDPEDGEVLEGFRPRTVTGSRSLGTERESLALEMFGTTASQLTREQIAIINRMLPERAGELSEARGRGTGAARIETELGMPLSVTEVAAQDVPFGTTMRDLVGFEPVTPDQRSRKEAVTTLAPQITNIRALITSVFPAASGLTGALTASAVLAGKRTRRDPDMAALTAAINLALGNVARVLAAESGRITEQDAERARSALADLQGFTDTRESALAKIAQAEAAIATIAASIRTPGEQMRGGGSVQFQGQTYNFSSQAQADLWLRAAEAEAAGR